MKASASSHGGLDFGGPSLREPSARSYDCRFTEIRDMDVDVVVIGSGAGGLTAAVALAQAGRKVLVVEQHYVPGGLCHSFTLGGYHFNTGVHYLGEFGPGALMRGIYEGLGVSRDVQFSEINPNAYDHIQLGRESFDIPKGRAAFTTALQRRFPNEAAGVAALLRTCEEMTREFVPIVDAWRPGAFLREVSRARHVSRWLLSSGRTFVDDFVHDPRLKAILNARSANHGLPPSRVSANFHAALLHHYFEGAVHPIGGGSMMARAFVRALERAGGEVRLSSRVDRILVERKRAIGVRLADGSDVRARLVVSNADPSVTFGRLIEPHHTPWWTRRKLRGTRYSLSTLSLFLAVDMDLRAAGLDSGNYWIFRDDDIERAFRESYAPQLRFDDNLDGFYFSVSSLKDPTKRRKGVHTAELFRLISYEPFARFAGTPEGNRGAEYDTLKVQVMDNLIATLDARFPGFKERVVFRELGTPLTNEFYTCATNGHMYGSEKSVWQAWPFGFGSRTPIKDLYMCGASTLYHGVTGATRAGLRTAQHILDCPMRDLLRADGPPLEVFPAEDLSQWPERLRVKITRGATPAQ